MSLSLDSFKPVTAIYNSEIVFWIDEFDDTKKIKTPDFITISEDFKLGFSSAEGASYIWFASSDINFYLNGGDSVNLLFDGYKKKFDFRFIPKAGKWQFNFSELSLKDMIAFNQCNLLKYRINNTGTYTEKIGEVDQDRAQLIKHLMFLFVKCHIDNHVKLLVK